MDRLGVHDDTLWAIDHWLGRINLFHRDGRVISAAPFSDFTVALERGIAVRILPGERLEDGGFVSQMVRSGSAPGGQASEAPATRVPRVLFAATGAVIDTLGTQAPPPPITPSLPRQIDVAGRHYTVVGVPHDAPLHVSFKDGYGIIDRVRPQTAALAAFDVARYDHSGEPVFQHRFLYRPVAYGDAVLDAIAEWSAQLPGDAPPRADGRDRVAPPSLAAIEAVRAALEYPDFQTPIHQAWAAPDGSLWLEREDRATPMRCWLVIDRDGSPRGNVGLPRSARPARAAGDTIWVTENDPMDVPWLVRYVLRADPINDAASTCR